MELFTIILASLKIYLRFLYQVSNENDTGLEEVITIPNHISETTDELIYTISPKHIYGYFNNKNWDFIRNEIWDPILLLHFYISRRNKLSRNPLKIKRGRKPKCQPLLNPQEKY